jgi:A/G-specific adenine glycosylase
MPMNAPNITAIQAFRGTVWDYYRQHGRDLPWRQLDNSGNLDAYGVLVSELMLQQTQVPRVIPKYVSFLEAFPDVKSLASTDLGAVLRLWSGLGYNHRAKFLWQAAQMIQQQFGGRVPNDAASLTSLPGIGPNTAGAVLAYAFHLPVVFIETNIRTVMIHHFFADNDQVSDADIRQLTELSLDTEQPREWYWALMDYGSYLKQVAGPVHRRSRTYAKQSQFDSSNRQLRGRVLRLVAKRPIATANLVALLNDDRANIVIETLQAEGLVVNDTGTLRLP